ncbi:MAG: C1 family peptidase [Candidatus Sericytochromatia bacterium]|nr:C1 family peptidase [Candidatus Tanganyikabacteria bacterium]
MPSGTATKTPRAAVSSNGAIDHDMLAHWRAEFAANPAYRLAMNACSQGNVDEIALNRRAISGLDWHFSNEVETGAISNQKRAGLCWMFAALNWLRIGVIEKLKVETFEFSQNYLTFWDRLEKANRFLSAMVALRDRPTDDRTIDFLVREPTPDGGEWHMVANLIRKYGLVPKSAMNDTANLTDSGFLNKVVGYKLRQTAAEIFAAQRKGAGQAAIDEIKRRALAEIYRLLCILLGEPPERFDFTYRDKKKKFHAHRNLTPRTFFREIVGLDLDDYVWVMSSPLESTPYHQTFWIEQFNNVVEGDPGRFLNLPMPDLKDLAVRVLKDKQAILFGCDVLQEASSRKLGVLAPGVLEYDLLFDMPFSMSRQERMQFLQARLTHNMVILGVDLVDDRPVKWKIENSWGDEVGNKGIFLMTDAWFDEHVYALIVHKRHLDSDQKARLKKKPTVLPPWHPLA